MSQSETLSDFLEDDAAGKSHASTKSCPMCGARNPLRAAECRDCGEPLTPFSATAQGQVWRDDKLLVMTKGATLPYRCVKTNDEAETLLRRTLYWHPGWVYVIVAVSPLIYIILALVLRQKADVEIPLCQRMRRRRLYALLSSWTCGLGMIGLLILGFVLSEPRFLGDAGLIVGFAGFFAGLIGLIVSLTLANLVSPTKIDKEHVWIKGVHADYLAALAEWPGKAGRS